MMKTKINIYKKIQGTRTYSTLTTALKPYVARYKEEPAFRKKLGLGLGAALMSFIAAANMPSTAANAKSSEERVVSLDEAIPEGSVLIPIKVQNESSLDGVLEESAYVDLYSAPEDEKKKSEKILSGIKMIRSPHQRDQFSVIVKSAEASQVVRAHGTFFVTLQSRIHHKSEMPVHAQGRLLTIGQN